MGRGNSRLENAYCRVSRNIDADGGSRIEGLIAADGYHKMKSCGIGWWLRNHLSNRPISVSATYLYDAKHQHERNFCGGAEKHGRRASFFLDRNCHSGKRLF